MREREFMVDKDDPAGTIIIHRVREHCRPRIETAERILFNAAAYRLDRELGIPEHIAVENNLTIRAKWPDMLFDY